jgi:NifB/MoaA-like Fe-S oxidoreductase
VLTGTFGAGVLGPMLADRADRVRVLAVENRYFGGTIGVAGLLTATDLASTLTEEPDDHRYLLPDACLSKGVFLDGGTLDDLPRRVEVVPTDGLSLRRALDGADAPAMPDRVAVPS